MLIINIHERILEASAIKVGELLDKLASANDKLWPYDRWPAMKFDRHLISGAIGGHGPIRYTIESYQPGRYILFRFIQPKEFVGTHSLEVNELEENKAKLRHVIEMQTFGMALVIWIFVIRPLHDALIEDALDNAEIYTGREPIKRNWSLWVKFLRHIMSRRSRSVRTRNK